jgi:ammonia channel protein AmtB
MYAIALYIHRLLIRLHFDSIGGCRPNIRLAFALYQMIFANTASTLVNGGMAERMHLPCYFTYGILQTGKI